MIPRIKHTIEEENWKKLFQNGISNIKELAEFLSLPIKELLSDDYDEAEITAGFPVKIPLPYARRIQKGNLEDPLLKQVLPTTFESIHTPSFVNDPLQEATYNPITGLLHKYQSRALMVLSGACPIHCRYCFRRNFNYQDNNPGKKDWEAAFDYLKNDKTINEVIFSGGDPLSLPDNYLEWLVQSISAIPNISRIRMHTRFPVVIPQRITTELTSLMENTPQKIVIVLHINHPQEIDDQVKSACKRLKEAGATLLNQSVLLNSINDCPTILTQLSEALFDADILPYYLHLPDKVAGTAHFDVTENSALRLHNEIQSRLPGFLVPRLVREIPGRSSKTLIPESIPSISL